MDSLDYWRLCDELSVFQAAVLIVGGDPSSSEAYIENWDVHQRPSGYEAAKTALINAVLQGDIPAKLTHARVYNSDDNLEEEIPDTVDINKTLISVTSIKQFLKSRGFNANFFLSSCEYNSPDYLSKDNPYYASKLAAAIEAWQTVTLDHSLLQGKTPKQAMMKWLRENASRFGLTKDDGSPNEQGIEEIAKIANWEQKGGAPKTPGEK